MQCPFCEEEDFDLPGLKMHFENGWCDKYNETELPRRWTPRSLNDTADEVDDARRD